MDDLQKLGIDQGYPFIIAGGIVYLMGAVLAVIADTPASQAVGGAKGK